MGAGSRVLSPQERRWVRVQDKHGVWAWVRVHNNLAQLQEKRKGK